MIKSFFKRFTTSSASDSLDVADLSSLGADMHSHLIPGIDDGAKTIEESLALITFLYNHGYTRLITTPHVMSDYFRNTPETILGGLQQVREAVKEAGIPVEIKAAAEYYVDDGFMRKLEEGPLLTFGDNYLLVEVSYINPPDSIFDILFKAQVKGYRPVLAHPERYPYWYRHPEQYRRFYEMGITLQVNLNSLSGYYGPDARRIAEKLIDMGIIGAIGTDMHHTKHAAALEQTLKEKYLHRLLDMPLINREL